jgi:hypothetical protein
MSSLMASDIYGTAPVYIPAVAPDTAISATDATSTTAGWRSVVDPHNPIVWFGVLLLVTVGAAGFAGSVRLGPAKVGAAVGKS